MVLLIFINQEVINLNKQKVTFSDKNKNISLKTIVTFLSITFKSENIHYYTFIYEYQYEVKTVQNKHHSKEGTTEPHSFQILAIDTKNNPQYNTQNNAQI